MELVVVLIGIGIITWIFKKRKKTYPTKPIENYRIFLTEQVEFYRELSKTQQQAFERRVQKFISTTSIIGVNTSLIYEDKLLVGAGAIIPVFEFSDWEYRNLNEVLIYPSAFDENYAVEGNEKRIQGMVGTGIMEGKMILSKPSLWAGFKNDDDKINVGIHEFAHLIDKADGCIDGIPSLLLKKQYTLPWLSHIKAEMEAIHAHDSDINPYGGVGKEEFFPVITEYFFEQPRLLEKKHPEIYALLKDIFTIDLAEKYKGIQRKSETGRNDPCPCGSGQKFKRCCLLMQ